jgi:hypothetical protein
MNLADCDFSALQSVFPAELAEVLWRHKVLSTAHNAKLVRPEQFMRMLLLHVGCDLPLRQTSAVLAEAGVLEISPMRIHKKLGAAAEALGTLVASMVSADDVDPERWGGYDVMLIDGSVVVSPGPTSAGGRLHIKQRLTTLQIVEGLVSHSYELGESLRNFEFSPGELVVVDRGYSTPVSIARVVSQGADVLVRVNRGALPLADLDGNAIDVSRWVEDCVGTRARSSRVVVHNQAGKRIEGRLIARRLPPNERGKARDRVVREHGSKATATDLKMAEYWALFTTVPASRLSDAQLLDLYRARWQIELQFKRWKSLCNFDTLKNWRPDTVVAWLYGKLFLALCVDQLTRNVERSFSPLGVVRRVAAA